MRIFGFMLVRDEADVIELTIRHHPALFDAIAVLDHGSTDGTSAILAALHAEGETVDMGLMTALAANYGIPRERWRSDIERLLVPAPPFLLTEETRYDALGRPPGLGSVLKHAERPLTASRSRDAGHAPDPRTASHARHGVRSCPASASMRLRSCTEARRVTMRSRSREAATVHRYGGNAEGFAMGAA